MHEDAEILNTSLADQLRQHVTALNTTTTENSSQECKVEPTQKNQSAQQSILTEKGTQSHDDLSQHTI